MSVIFKRGNAEIEANLTPMIDVTFLLIVFFVLVSQIVSKENQPMELPEPTDPASELVSDDERAVINIVHGGQGRADEIWLGTRRYETSRAGIEAIAQQLQRLYSSNPSLQVNLRADRAVHYTYVQQVMDAISEAASNASDETPIRPRLNLAIERREAS